MKNTPQFLRQLPLFVLLFGLMLALGARTAPAASPTPPNLMSYQGYLVDATGAPLAPATPANYSIVFRIHGASTGGAILWSEQQSVTVDKGNFSVVLGEGAPVSGEARPVLSSVFTGATASDRYLGITVTIGGTPMTISPRLRLLPSAYALTAITASTASTAITAGSATTATALVNSSGANLITTSNSNVGIGIPAPRAKLEVDGNVIVKGAAGGNNWNNQRLLWGGDGTGWPLSFASINNLGTINSPVLTMLDNGTVGIGTTTPSRLLQVGKGDLIGLGGVLINTGWIDPANQSANPPFDVQVRGISKLFVSTFGNVGIQKPAPIYPLDVSGSIGIQNGNVLDLGVGKAGREPSAGKIGYETFGAGALHIVGAGWTNSNGSANSRIIRVWDQIGIGTSNPRAPLDVTSAAASFQTLGWYLDGFGVANHGGNSFVQWNYSIIADGTMYAAGYHTPSDNRIKQISRRTSGQDALDSIRQLQISDYTYIDKVERGSREHRGLIAQELEKIIPAAITRGTGFVPDIYDRATSVQFDAASQALTINLPKAHGVKVQDVVSLIMEDGKKEVAVSAVPTPTSFVVKAEKNSSRVFVFGKKVNDFRVVDYDHVFSTGISAIQELDRQMQTLNQSQARIAELERKTGRMAELETKASRVEALEKRMHELEGVERQVAELRKLVSELASAAPRASRPVAALSEPKAAIASVNR